MARRSGCAGVMSSQVAKPAKPAPSFGMASIAAAGTSLARMRAEQIGEGDQEVLDAACSFAYSSRSSRHGVLVPSDVSLRAAKLAALRTARASVSAAVPESSRCRRAARRAIAAASMVSATRSSGSRLCTWLLAAGARDGLRLQRQHREVVGEPPAGRDRIEAASPAPGPAW